MGAQKKKWITLVIHLILYHAYFAQLKLSKSSFFDSLVNVQLDKYPEIKLNPAKYRLQIIYTQINRDKNNEPVFTNYGYRVNNPAYFYCASLVKLPCSILALEKINLLEKYKVTMNTPLMIDSSNSCQRTWHRDWTSENKLPTVAHYIKRMMLVSDNHSYSRVYEFLTNDFIHARLKELGFPKVKIVVRFDGLCKGENHFISNPLYFQAADSSILYKQESVHSKNVLPVSSKPLLVGKAMIDGNGKKIKKGKDFSRTNYLELADEHSILRNLIFLPYKNVGKKKYTITTDQRLFLIEHMGMWPRESTFPHYDSSYYDSHKKYLFYGASVKRVTNDSVRIFNIVGQSYGFVSDCAYIVDQQNGVEFLLSAVIYTNKNGIINDGIYECGSVGLPFLADLGKLFYSYEKLRVKKIKPDLKEFQFDFKN